MSVLNPTPDWTSCQTRPELSPAKAYAICGRLKRMMKNKGIEKYQDIHYSLMNISGNKKFKKLVENTLINKLKFTKTQTKEFINEHF